MSEAAADKAETKIAALTTVGSYDKVELSTTVVLRLTRTHYRNSGKIEDIHKW